MLIKVAWSAINASSIEEVILVSREVSYTEPGPKWYSGSVTKKKNKYDLTVKYKNLDKVEKQVGFCFEDIDSATHSKDEVIKQIKELEMHEVTNLLEKAITENGSK